MTGRPGRRRRDSSSPLVDLEVVFADDEMIDGIAASVWGSPVPHDELAARARRPSTAGQPGTSVLSIPQQFRKVRPGSVDPLPELFRLWRQELAADPIPAPPPIRRAVVPKAPVSRGRALRPAVSIAAAIAMLLAGSATVGAKTAEPEDVLWPITVMVWPERAQSVQSVLEVRAALAEARTAIDDGRPEDAKLALLRAAVQLGNVDDVDGRAGMELAVTDLWAASAPAERAPDAQVHQVGGPNSATAPSPSGSAGSPSAPGLGAIVGPAGAPSPVAVVLGAPVQAAPDGTADRGSAPAGSGAGGPGSGVVGAAIGNGSTGSGAAGSGAAGNGAAGNGGGLASSGSGSSSGSGVSAGSDEAGNAPAAVAIPTPPVSVATPTAPATSPTSPGASATEQSPPTPSQTTDPSDTGGGKATGGEAQSVDGSQPVDSSAVTAADSASSGAESLTGVEAPAG